MIRKVLLMFKKMLSCLLVCVIALSICLSGCKNEGANAQFGNVKYEYKYASGEKTAAVVPEGIADNSVLSGLNFIDDTTPVTIPKKVKSSKKRVPGSAYAVDVKYDDGTGVCVAIYDVVKDFDACIDGTQDATPAIQKAVRSASANGGGVVYMPEGIYLCENSIEIPSGVTLRGEWVSPEIQPAGSCGTVILVRSKARGRESGNAFIKLKAGAGIRNMTIIYPDQTVDEIAKYPATLQEAGGDSFTAMNMTIAGCWNGYQGNLNWSELHYLKNMYITAFNNAIMLDNITDIGRLEGMHISPSYFTENTVNNFSDGDKKIIKDYMFQYAVGLWMQRSDWEYIYDFNAEDIYCAVRQIYNKENRAANAQYCNVNLKNCNIGIDIQATNAIGCVFTDINIEGNKNCEYGVLMNGGFAETSEFQNLHIKGAIKQQFACIGNGSLTMLNSTFKDWNSDEYAVDMKHGSISIQQCDFADKKHHIRIDKSCGGVSVLGCTFGGEADIEHAENKDKFIYINDETLPIPRTSGRLHVYRRSIPTAASTAVYSVTDYGAKVNTDSTDAFVAALEAARKTGGVVYVPGGEFTVSKSLTVPSGVELRGVYNVPTHSVTKGSIIKTTLGKGDANGEPLIKLESGSGVNGVSFYYPEQNYTNFIPYPYTVQSLGENCWAINTVFINSYKALDFATNPSDGHYIQYCSGAPLVEGLFVGNNSSNGWVENCQFNPHYWKRAALDVKPQEGADEFNNVINLTLDAFIFGDNASEHMLGNFAYAGNNLLKFISQGKGGTNATIVGHGSDGCQNALVVDEADTLEFINAELVSMNGPDEKHHITMNSGVTGTVALFNSMMWAQPTKESINIKGGKLVISQLSYYNLEQTVNLVGAFGGELYYGAVMMLPKECQIKASGSAKVQLVGNIARQSLALVAPADGAKASISNSGANLTEIATWWS